MADVSHDNRTPTTEAQLNACTIGGARLHAGPIQLVEYDVTWPRLFPQEAARITRILGGRAVTLEHVGSTSVPGLAAKANIDIVMEVENSAEESIYVADLEANGYELRIREPLEFEECTGKKAVEQELAFLISDLHRMEETDIFDAEPTMLYGGVDSPTGRRWYNFDPCAFVECALRGAVTLAEEDAVTHVLDPDWSSVVNVPLIR